MKALSVSEKQFMLVGLCAESSGEIFWKKLITGLIILFVVFITGLLPGVRYIVLINKDDILGSIFAAMTALAVVNLIFSFITIFLNREKCRIIIDTIRQTVNKGK